MADGIIQSSASRYVSGRPSELSDQSAISGRAGVSLFTASLLALFVELALIRWIPSVVHVVGFFANVVIMSAFRVLDLSFANGIRLPLSVILVGVFMLVAWTLMPFGQLIAGPFDELGRLPAYTVNIVGSLAGVAVFTLMSALGTPSIVWFVAALLFLLFHTGFRVVVPALGLIVVVLGLVYYADTGGLDGDVLWSPYNQLRVRPMGVDIDDGFT